MTTDGYEGRGFGMSLSADIGVRSNCLTPRSCISVWGLSNWQLPSKGQSWLRDTGTQTPNSGKKSVSLQKVKQTKHKIGTWRAFGSWEAWEAFDSFRAGITIGTWFSYKWRGEGEKNTKGTWLKQRLEWSVLTVDLARAGLRESLLLPVTSGFCLRDRDVSNHFSKCAYANHVDHSISDLLLQLGINSKSTEPFHVWKDYLNIIFLIRPKATTQ